MNEMLGKGLNFIFVIGVSLGLHSLFKITNYNEWFSLVLCVCTAHWISATIRQFIEEVKDND